MDDYYDDTEEHWGWGYHPSSQTYPNSSSFAGGSCQYDSTNGNEDSDCDDNSTPLNFENTASLSVKTDDKNRRIISRESLFEDPESFQFITSYIVQKKKQNDVSNQSQNDQNEQEIPVQHPDPKYDAGFDWTQRNWQKAGNISSSEQIYQQPGPRLKFIKPTKMQKRLTAALSKPVKISKAESMMQKMGWQGGALGKSGDGIIEPIAPNASYGSRFGFGQRLEPVKGKQKQQKQKKPTKPSKLKFKTHKEIYKTNVLNHILDFVRNDFEVEIKFDYKLPPIERKHIHSIVNEVINCSDENVIDMDFDNLVQMDILQEIKRSNIFVLGTQSEGQQPKRCLCIFKEAPRHMYLITPADLRDNEEGIEESEEIIDLTEEENVNQTEESKNQPLNKEMEVETETSPLENPPNIIKNDEKSTDDVTEKFKEHCNIKENLVDPEILKKLVAYFTEYIETEVYMEFRFLGTYNKEEIETINYFLRNYFALINLLQDKQKVLENLESSGYYLQCMEDDNGSILFLKLPHKATNK